MLSGFKFKKNLVFGFKFKNDELLLKQMVVNGSRRVIPVLYFNITLKNSKKNVHVFNDQHIPGNNDLKIAITNTDISKIQIDTRAAYANGAWSLTFYKQLTRHNLNDDSLVFFEHSHNYDTAANKNQIVINR